MKPLSTLLRDHRKRLGLTQMELSARMSFSHTVISRVETGDSGYLPSEDYIEAACAALQLSPVEEQELWQVYRQAAGRRHAGGEQGGLPAARPVKKYTLYLLLLALPLIAAAAWLAVGRNDGRPLALPYGDDFEPPGDSLKNWDLLNSGSWQVFETDGTHVFGVKGQDYNVVANAFLEGSEGWEDYAVTSDVIFETGVYEQIYFVVRTAGRRNNCTGYRVGGNRQGVEIFRFDSVNGDCRGERLAFNPEGRLVSHKWYNFRVEVQGDEVRLYLDDRLMAEAQDGRYPMGGLGLLAYEVNHAGFDNLMIEELSRAE